MTESLFPQKILGQERKKRDLDLKQRELSSILKQFFTSKYAILCFVVLWSLKCFRKY